MEDAQAAGATRATERLRFSAWSRAPSREEPPPPQTTKRPTWTCHRVAAQIWSVRFCWLWPWLWRRARLHPFTCHHSEKLCLVFEDEESLYYLARMYPCGLCRFLAKRCCVLSGKGKQVLSTAPRSCTGQRKPAGSIRQKACKGLPTLSPACPPTPCPPHPAACPPGLRWEQTPFRRLGREGSEAHSPPRQRLLLSHRAP